MIKKIVICLCLFVGTLVFAQEGTSSPYSFYGIGDIKFKGTAETRAMGSLSIIPDSIHVNLQNPAHFASLKLTVFGVGATSLNARMKTESQEEKARRVSLDYLAVGIPAGKFGFGFGLLPYSSVGYKIRNINTDENQFSTQYTGIGGINKVFFGAAYKITKNLNFGADVNFNFGTVETDSFTFLSGVQNGTLEENNTEIQGFSFTAGLSYQRKVTEKHHLFISTVYSPSSELKLNNERIITVGSDQEEVPVANTTMTLPSKFSFGSGFGEVKKWLVGAEVTFQSNSDLKNRFDDINEATFENSTRFSLGGYYIPNYNSYSGYFKRVTYRAGFRYENTGIVLKEKSINDVAATIGFGLPLGGTFSKVNVGLEIGKRGTRYFNLVEENYINLTVGLAFSDRWFVKRKYD